MRLHMKSAANDLIRHTSQLLLENCKIRITQENFCFRKKAALFKTLYRISRSGVKKTIIYIFLNMIMNILIYFFNLLLMTM